MRWRLCTHPAGHSNVSSLAHTPTRGRRIREISFIQPVLADHQKMHKVLGFRDRQNKALKNELWLWMMPWRCCESVCVCAYIHIHTYVCMHTHTDTLGKPNMVWGLSKGSIPALVPKTQFPLLPCHRFSSTLHHDQLGSSKWEISVHYWSKISTRFFLPWLTLPHLLRLIPFICENAHISPIH